MADNFFTPIANMWFNLLHWINNGITKDMTAAVTVTIIAFFIFIYIAFRYFVIARLLKDQDQTNITNTLSIILSISFTTLGVYTGVIVSVAGLVTPLIVVIVIGIALTIWFGLWASFRTSHAAFSEVTAEANEKIGESLARKANAANKLRTDLGSAWNQFRRDRVNIENVKKEIGSAFNQLQDDETKIIDNLKQIRHMLEAAKQANAYPKAAAQAAANINIGLTKIGDEKKFAEAFYDHAISSSIKKPTKIDLAQVSKNITAVDNTINHLAQKLPKIASPKGATKAQKAALAKDLATEQAVLAQAKTRLATAKSELGTWKNNYNAEITAISSKEADIKKRFKLTFMKLKGKISEYRSKSSNQQPDVLNRLVDEAIAEVDALLTISITEVRLDEAIAQHLDRYSAEILQIENEINAINTFLGTSPIMGLLGKPRIQP